MVDGIRAISSEQKREKRQVILNVAQELFMRKQYQTITIAEIAKGACIAKGTVFLYFQTKEMIFLTLISDYYEEWFKSVNSLLTKIVNQGLKLQIEEFTEIIRASIMKNSVLCKTVPILHVILEQNIDYNTILSFRKMLFSRITITACFFEKCLPFLGKGEGAALILTIHTLVIGLHQMANPSDVVKQVILESNMKMFNIDFAEFFSFSLSRILYGMKSLSES